LGINFFRGTACSISPLKFQMMRLSAFARSFFELKRVVSFSPGPPHLFFPAWQVAVCASHFLYRSGSALRQPWGGDLDFVFPIFLLCFCSPYLNDVFIQVCSGFFVRAEAGDSKNNMHPEPAILPLFRQSDFPVCTACRPFSSLFHPPFLSFFFFFFVEVPT